MKEIRISTTLQGKVEEILAQLKDCGYRGQIVSIQHLHALKEGVEGPHRNRLLDETFYQEWLSGFNYNTPESLPDAKSIIVIAVPQPQTRITFIWKSRSMYAIVPPTYLHASQINQQLEDLLGIILGRQGYRVVQATLPVKLLAVCSGMASYGRNNITYIEGMGSFYRLVTFYSDFPCQDDNWLEPQMMGACSQCYACQHNCPAGAIQPDRFLLHAERCLTYHNEKPGNVSFSSWIDPGWHNCLVGCLYCQKICPQNRHLLDWIEDGASFTQEETKILMLRAQRDLLSPVTWRKLEQWDLVSLLDVLPRNLNVLLDRI